MADKGWCKQAFSEGYSSGIVLGPLDPEDPEAKMRMFEDKRIGGSLSEFFLSGVAPLLQPHDKVLELGPGRGSWTRALASVITEGEIHTVDLQDIRPWVQDLIETAGQRLFIHQVAVDENEYAFLPDRYFDAFFSFGVLCHMDLDIIEDLLVHLRPKLKKDCICIAQYADWEKAVRYCMDPEAYAFNREGYEILEKDYAFELDLLRCRRWYQKLRPLWKRYILRAYPQSEVPPERSFWVKMNQKDMKKLLIRAGYEVLAIDMDYFRRDPVALFRPLH